MLSKELKPPSKELKAPKPPIEGRYGIEDPANSVDFNNGLKMAATIKAQGFFECSAKTRVRV